MMSQSEGLEAWQLIRPHFIAEIRDLSNNKEYEMPKFQQSNVRSAFNLIDDKEVPKTNQNRWNARTYFLVVISHSKELFILSALVGGSALLRTFGSSGQISAFLAQEAWDWFRSELVPRRLTLITELYFVQRRKKAHLTKHAGADFYS